MELPVEVFIKELTYLPFKDVISLCQVNRTNRMYCLNPRYKNLWKSLIDNTFSDTLGYTDNLKKIWDYLEYPADTYNYLVYVNLVKLLDPVTQLQIYYIQGDMDSFNSDEFTDKQRFLAYFVMGNKEAVRENLPHDVYSPFLDMMEGKDLNTRLLDWMLLQMAVHGSPEGIAMIIDKGANPHAWHDGPLMYARNNKHNESAKYLERYQ